LSRIWAKAPPLTSALVLRFLPHTRTDTQTEPEAHEPEAHTEGHERERERQTEREREKRTNLSVSFQNPKGLGFRVSGLGLGGFRRGDSQCLLKTVSFKAHVSTKLKTPVCVSSQGPCLHYTQRECVRVRASLRANTYARCVHVQQEVSHTQNTNTNTHTHSRSLSRSLSLSLSLSLTHTHTHTHTHT
jgi:hypothetical protein